MTLPADAQALHDDAAARGKWLIWTFTDNELEYPGRHVARSDIRIAAGRD